MAENYQSSEAYCLLLVLSPIEHTITPRPVSSPILSTRHNRTQWVRRIFTYELAQDIDTIAIKLDIQGFCRGDSISTRTDRLSKGRLDALLIIDARKGFPTVTLIPIRSNL